MRGFTPHDIDPMTFVWLMTTMNPAQFGVRRLRGAEPAPPASKQPNNSAYSRSSTLKPSSLARTPTPAPLASGATIFAGEAEDGGLVRRAVADDEGGRRRPERRGRDGLRCRAARSPRRRARGRRRVMP